MPVLLTTMASARPSPVTSAKTGPPGACSPWYGPAGPGFVAGLEGGSGGAADGDGCRC